MTTSYFPYNIPYSFHDTFQKFRFIFTGTMKGLCTICFEVVFPVEVWMIYVSCRLWLTVLFWQAIHLCCNEHHFHAKCFNTFGAERSRHCAKYQLDFKILCPVCKCDETSRFVVVANQCSSLLSSEITTTFEGQSEEYSVDGDTTFTEEVAAILARGPFCAVCKDVVDRDQPYQCCCLCERKFHSVDCHAKEIAGINALGLQRVTQGSFVYSLTSRRSNYDTFSQGSPASTAHRQSRTYKRRSSPRSICAITTSNAG